MKYFITALSCGNDKVAGSFSRNVDMWNQASTAADYPSNDYYAIEGIIASSVSDYAKRPLRCFVPRDYEDLDLAL